MDPQIGRRTWRTLEPIHGAIYFVPEATEEYARLGLGDWGSGYFASRAAALGAVGAEVVKATFTILILALSSGAWTERGKPSPLSSCR